MTSDATEIGQPQAPTASRRRTERAIAFTAAVVLAGLTFVTVHPVANAAVYAVAQVLLVRIAAVDFATRRIPNQLVAALAAIALVSRAIAERPSLVERVVAGIAVFAVALLLANLARGGLGMGDVKLAGALGFLLGKAVFVALLFGTVAGAAIAVVILIRQGAAGRRTTLAYGPYLALGGVLAILAFGPPPLV
jgi:leader peptidase (prepilin peptidase) / N-methyltransferase